jgi:hypothetical protein
LAITDHDEVTYRRRLILQHEEGNVAEYAARFTACIQAVDRGNAHGDGEAHDEVNK